MKNNSVKSSIEGFVLAIQKEEYAKADAFLSSAIKTKINKIYSEEYEKIKKEKRKG